MKRLEESQQKVVCRCRIDELLVVLMLYSYNNALHILYIEGELHNFPPHFFYRRTRLGYGRVGNHVSTRS